MSTSSARNLPGINFDEGILRVAGNENLYVRLLKQFADKHGDDIDQLSDALNAGDEARAREILHTLKGVAGSISLDDLHEAVCTFDEGVDAERLARMQEHMRVVKDSIAQL